MKDTDFAIVKDEEGSPEPESNKTLLNKQVLNTEKKNNPGVTLLRSGFALRGNHRK